MPLTVEATHKKWIKASEEWTQETHKGEKFQEATHFDRNFTIDDMTWRCVGSNLKFNVKLKTFGGNESYYPFVIIQTDSHEILNDFKIQIEYSIEGKSGSLTFNPSIESLSRFKSECKYEN